MLHVWVIEEKSIGMTIWKPRYKKGRWRVVDVARTKKSANAKLLGMPTNLHLWTRRIVKYVQEAP